MKTLLCRIGWMEFYNGTEELYRGNQEWAEDDNGEAWNFMPGEDCVIRGFVMITARDREGEYTGTININRLGANTSDREINGINIIFFAPHPEKNDMPCIVGWYKNAKVYRNWKSDYRKNYREQQPYSFEVSPNNAFLINAEKRNTRIITAQYAAANDIIGSYPGMSNVFFCESNREYVKGIIKKTKKFKKHAR